MKHLFIFGNGFDLDLGLQTSYKNFLESPHFLGLCERKEPNPLAKHLLDQLEINNWVDVELELETFEKIRRPTFDNSHNDYHEIKRELFNYLSNIDVKKFKLESAAYDLFTRAFSEDAEVYVLNFNYTKTAEIIYAQCTGRFEKKLGDKNKFTYVHGSLEENNIILSLHDSADLKNNAFLRKSSSQNFSKILNKDYLNSFGKITFFGHSLGKTDHDYFTDFFLSCADGTLPNKIVRIYTKGVTGKNGIDVELHAMTKKPSALKMRDFEIIDVESL